MVPTDIVTDIDPDEGTVLDVVVEEVDEVDDVEDVVGEVVVLAEVEKIQLPRPEQRSYPTRHDAPLFPEVMSRNEMLFA